VLFTVVFAVCTPVIIILLALFVKKRFESVGVCVCVCVCVCAFVCV